MKREELKAYNVVVSDECADYICGQNQLEFEAYAADDVDAVISEKDAENRKLKRALWMARKAHAVAMFAYWDSHYRDNPNAVYRNRTIDWLRNRWLLILDAIIKKEKECK